MNETVIADEKEETLRNKLRILRDTEDSYGADSIETETEKTEAAELCCTIALSSVYESKPQSPNPESDQMERAKSLLEAALILLRPGTIQPTVKVIQTRASVYSNIAMLYRKTGRLRAALISSQKASNLYRSLSLPDDPTVSESLISSLLSESSLLCSSGKPKDGLIVAKEALLLCSNLEVMARQQQDILSSDQNKRSAASEELPEDFHYANLQAMCHHNVGVCQEFLGKCRQCLNSYRTAFQLAYLSGGPDHPLSVRFKECFASAYADAHKKRTKQHMRAIARIKKYDPQPSAIIAAGERRQRLVPVNAAAAKRYNINNRLPKEAGTLLSDGQFTPKVATNR